MKQQDEREFSAEAKSMSLPANKRTYTVSSIFPVKKGVFLTKW